MRIFHIINSLGNGGSESSLYEIIINQKKINHYIFTLFDKGLIFTKFKSVKNCKVFDLSKLSFISKIIFIVDVVKKDKKIFEEIIINSWMYRSHIFTYVLSFFINIKFFMHVRHCGITKNHSLINKIPIIISRYISKKTNLVIYNSISSKINHEKFGYKKNSKIVFNGFKENTEKKNLKKKLFKNKIVLGMLARSNFIKDHLTLIRAFKTIQIKKKNLVLLLQGANLKKNKQILLEIKKNKNIILSNTFNKDFYYQNIDINILSSHGESFPNVIAEGILRNKITIASSVGDVKRIIKKKYTFPAGNQKILEKILLNIINSKNKNKFISDLSSMKRIILKKYSFVKQSENFLKLWKSFYHSKKIIFIVPSLVSGGAERVVLSIAEYLVKRKIIVDILVLGKKSHNQYDHNKKITLKYLNKQRSLFAFLNIIKIFSKNSYGVIFSTIIQCNILCSLAHILTFRKNNFFIRETNTPSSILKYDFNIKNLLLIYARKLYSTANKVLCNSYGMMKDLNLRIGINRKKLYLLPNIINHSELLKKSKNQIKNLKKPYFLYAGRFTKQKNIMLILRSFYNFSKNFSSYNLYLAGNGQDYYVNQFREFIKKKEIDSKVKILNFKKNIFKYIANAEAVLLSSNWEGMPNIVVQSLFLNKKVLCTNCKSGPLELKNFGYKLKLSRVNDEIDYTKKLKELIKWKIKNTLNSKINFKYKKVQKKQINILFNL